MERHLHIHRHSLPLSVLHCMCVNDMCTYTIYVCVYVYTVHAYYKFGSAFTQQNFYCFVLERRRRRCRRCLIVVLTSLL